MAVISYNYVIVCLFNRPISFPNSEPCHFNKPEQENKNEDYIISTIHESKCFQHT